MIIRQEQPGTIVYLISCDPPPTQKGLPQQTFTEGAQPPHSYIFPI